jgi:hypothetical protein
MGKTALFVFAATFPLVAQQPVRVDVYTHDSTTPGLQWAQLVTQMGSQGVDAINQGFASGTQAKLADQRQQEINLERRRLDREQEDGRRSARLQDRMLDSNFGYRDARPRVADWRINQDVLDAFTAARKAHPDFDRLQPIMRVVAEAMRPDWSYVTMPEYIECLYAIAKTANFVEPARQKILDARNTGQ